MSKRVLVLSLSDSEEAENEGDPMEVELVPLLPSLSPQPVVQQQPPAKRARLLDLTNDPEEEDTIWIVNPSPVVVVPRAPPLVIDLAGEEEEVGPKQNQEEEYATYLEKQEMNRVLYAGPIEEKPLICGARPTQLVNLWLLALVGGRFRRVTRIRRRLPTLFHLLRQRLVAMGEAQVVDVIIESLALLDDMPGRQARRHALSGRVTLPAGSEGRLKERLQELQAMDPREDDDRPLLLSPLLKPSRGGEEEEEEEDTTLHVPHAKAICSVHALNPLHKANFDLAILETLLGHTTDLALFMPATAVHLAIMIHNDARLVDLCHLVHELLLLALEPGIQAHRVTQCLLALVPDNIVVDSLITHGYATLQEACAYEDDDDDSDPRARQYHYMANVRVQELSELAETLKPIRVAVRSFIEAKPRRLYKHLYEYQKFAVQWMVERAMQPRVLGHRFQGGVVAAMAGMGKTRIALATITLLLSKYDQARVVVLVPKPVLREWIVENHRLFKQRIALLHKSTIVSEEDEEEVLAQGMGDPTEAQVTVWMQGPAPMQIILSTVQTFVKRFRPGLPLYGQLAPRLGILVVDEIHVMSNKQRKDYGQLVQQLEASAPIRFGLTGTPFRNNHLDLLHQVGFLDPEWQENFIRIHHGGDEQGAANDPVLLEQYLRLDYGRDTVELVPFERRERYIPLNPLDRDMYNYLAQEMPGRTGLIRLRQAAISPDLVPPEVFLEIYQRALAKAEKTRIKVEAQEVKRLQREERSLSRRGGQPMEGHSSMGFIQPLWSVMSQVSSWWSRAAVDDDSQQTQPITLPPPTPAPPELRLFEHAQVPNYMSSKMMALMHLLRQLLLPPAPVDEKILVFSTFVGAIQRAQEFMARDPDLSAIGSELFIGALSNRARAQVRHALDHDPNMRVLFLTYQAGGTGLNLQRANHQVELDPPGYTDALNIQAQARVWRVRQTRMVIKHCLISEDTHEERMLHIQAMKRAMWQEMMERTPDANILTRKKEVFLVESDEESDDDSSIEFLTSQWQHALDLSSWS